MSKFIHIRFFQSDKLGNEDSLESLLLAITNRGFKISTIVVGHWATNNISLFFKEFTPELFKEISIAYEKSQIQFNILDLKIRLAMTAELNWDSQNNSNMSTMTITHSDTGLYYYNDVNPEFNTDRLLFLSKIIYNEIKPTYGWIEKCWVTGYTKDDDINNRLIPHIYWGNFFGPDYVQVVGEDFLKNAPGYLIEKLKDGGYLYVLTSKAGGKSPKGLNEDVKVYFGDATVRINPRKKNKQ